MTKNVSDFSWISSEFGCSPLASTYLQTAIQRLALCMVGFGSLGRPLSELLASKGVTDFTLIDPKRFRPCSIQSQCTADEVGELKVDVGRKVLGNYAKVRAYPRDVFDIPAGVVRPNSFLVATVDNRRADICANQMACMAKTVLVKVNVEPAFDTVAIRVVDFRGAVELCAVCGFSAEQFRAQRHPRSCDARVSERPTNASRSLSAAASQAAALVIAQVAAGLNLEKFVGCEWLLNVKSKRSVRSTLFGNPHCRFDHASCWENVQRLESGPRETRLCDLLTASEAAGATLRFCQQIVLRGRCGNCHAECECVRWASNLHDPIADCPYCGSEFETGKLFPIPYWSYSQLPAVKLQSVLHIPLAEWGVEPQAVIGIRCGNAVRTVIVSDEESDLAEVYKRGEK